MMKCEKCGYISFDWNDMCPSCDTDLVVVRERLGFYQVDPPTDLSVLLTSGPHVVTVQDDDYDLDLSGISPEEDIDWTLDD
jgi:hypothetical protein